MGSEMKKQNKYRQGEVIETMEELDRWIEPRRLNYYKSYHRWIYLHKKVMHPAFLTSMTYRTIKMFIKNKAIKKAMLNKEEKCQI